MEDSEKKTKSNNPCAQSNILSYVIYRWTTKIFSIGQKRPLEFSDFYEPLNEHSSFILVEEFNRLWQEKLKNGSPSLTRVIVQCFWKQISLNLFVYLLSECFFKVLQPLCLGKIISYYAPGENNMSRSDLHFYTFGFILCSIINFVMRHPLTFSNSHLAMKARVGCCALVYRKILKISSAENKNSSSGQVVNLLAKDVSAFDFSCIWLLNLISAPLQAIIMTVFMYQMIGVSAVIGNLCIVLTIPVQFFLGTVMKNKKKDSMPLTDTRLNFVTEVISGIKVIKMFTWELPFIKKLNFLRKNEINKLKYVAYARAILLSLMLYSTRFALFISIIAYVSFGNILSAENIFVIICFYNYMALGLCTLFPIAVTSFAELNVALKRLETFLLQKELETLPQTSTNSEVKKKIDVDEPLIINEKQNKTKWIENDNAKDIDEDSEKEKLLGQKSVLENNDEFSKNIKSDYAVNLDSVYMKWNSSQSEFNLSNISTKIQHGRLVAIIGEVGSGKSSLFHTILKETPITSGLISIDGKISYASQDSWLFNSSIRQNILFGSEMNQNRYDKVLKSCILEKDIILMPNGDKTVVGEKGMKISGGQQARVNLARTVYKNAEIYLLDDPLSAVDCHVGRKLFDECILDFLKNKTRLLITHQYQYLSKVDHIMMFDNGYLKAEGSFNELQENCPAFQNLIKNKENVAEENIEESKIEDNTNETRDNDAKDDMSEEKQKEGSVDFKIYKSYVASSGPLILFILFLILFIFSQIFASYSDYWVLVWVNAEEKAFNTFNFSNYNNLSDNYINSVSLTDQIDTFELNYKEDRNYYIYMYSGIIAFLIATGILRVVMFFWLCLRASINLHNDMFKSIIHATMRFFHTTPIGRILNRFTYDMSMVDEILPKIVFDCFQIFGQMLGIVLVIVSINVWLLIPTSISIGLFIYLRSYYTMVARSVKRLEAMARSPIFSHLNASYHGLPTIRAFGVQETLEKEFYRHQNLHSSIWFMFQGTARAFGLWLDTVCMGYLITVVVMLIYLGTETGGNIGLGVTQAIGIIGVFQYAVKSLTEVETLMTSVERISEYQNIEQESPLNMAIDKKLTNNWPLHGKIEFENVSSKYSPTGRCILKNLTFIIEPQEKIGIVGRSGSGKTSIINTVFKMIFVDGTIKIDGIDTNSIGLHKLRNSISVIPQEPILFTGTLRYNLDPFSKWDDATLWMALDQVEMKDVIAGLKSGLDTNISGSNSSFSVGQRQLLCLARAIICRNRILILDEATANVDPKTDSLIQKTIREEFVSYTVFTIAHRLQTIMDSDKVMVMDNGEIIEFDNPYLLLQNENGKFSNMVQTTKDTGEDLYEIAKESYARRQQQ